MPVYSEDPMEEREQCQARAQRELDESTLIIKENAVKENWNPKRRQAALKVAKSRFRLKQKEIQYDYERTRHVELELKYTTEFEMPQMEK